MFSPSYYFFLPNIPFKSQAHPASATLCSNLSFLIATDSALIHVEHFPRHYTLCKLVCNVFHLGQYEYYVVLISTTSSPLFLPLKIFLPTSFCILLYVFPFVSASHCFSHGTSVLLLINDLTLPYEMLSIFKLCFCNPVSTFPSL